MASSLYVAEPGSNESPSAGAVDLLATGGIVAAASLRVRQRRNPRWHRRRGRWPEVLDGWLSGGGSSHASNITHAAKLRGKLLRTVGELDRNVDPASTMQVANALLAADKDFELVVVPGGGHGVGELPALARRRQDFFVRHLHGVEPRGR